MRPPDERRSVRHLADSGLNASQIARSTGIQRSTPTSRVGLAQRKECVEIRSHSRLWPCLLPQHGAGPKHTRRIEMTHWQAAIVRRRPQQFIRGLLDSDGCRITNFATTRDGRRYEYPRYLFTNASEDTRALFCEALEQVGARYAHPSPRNVSIARAESIQLLDAFVGPNS